jgi:cytochrome c556
MGRSPYQSEKRRKELARLKKQEEKRQRRFNKKHEGEAGSQAEDGTPGETQEPGEQPADAAQPDAAPADPTHAAGDEGTERPS